MPPSTPLVGGDRMLRAYAASLLAVNQLNGVYLPLELIRGDTLPSILQWLFRFGPTNPICTRLAVTGSRRESHLAIRTAYLVILMTIFLVALLGDSGTLRAMAQRGAQAFTIISFGQVFLICLLTPVFMSGAITQEANTQTWDILLTSPLNAFQIVIGNLLGRLFFIFSLLLSTLPIFLVTQFFGGVPGTSIFTALGISAASALIVGAIAITLSVTRTGGRRAVFLFYVAVVFYLAVTWLVDGQLRTQIAVGSLAEGTTIMTPLNPFLALEAVLLSNSYAANAPIGSGRFMSFWLLHPVGLFYSLSLLISFGLMFFSTFRVRLLGSRSSQIPFLRRISPSFLTSDGVRAPRVVGENPIAWWERDCRSRALGPRLGRFFFIGFGALSLLLILGLFLNGSIDVPLCRLLLLATLTIETVIILLTALNLSATAVSREREDGTLDLILTTPIQPGPYLSGKLRGLIQGLASMLLVPIVTLLFIAILVVAFPSKFESISQVGTNSVQLPLILPEMSLLFPLVLISCTAMCVMVGLQWSLRSRSTIGSVTSALLILVMVLFVLGLCGVNAGSSIEVVGAFFASLSPINLILAGVNPAEFLYASVSNPGQVIGARIALAIGAIVAACAYCGVVFVIPASMKRSFMMAVRRLSGNS
jgi:ABC-type transport system involved in multi-copper enzyme maturation permease subunit